MNLENAKVHIKIKDTEITIAGKPNFVSNQVQQILKLLSPKPAASPKLSTSEKNESPSSKTKKQSKRRQKAAAPLQPKNQNQIINALGNDFKNWLSQLPPSHDKRDEILIAAYYIQVNAKEKKFHIPDIKRLFETYDLSMPNISGFLDTMEIQKLVLKTSTSTRKGYRVMEGGEQYIRKLMLNEAHEK